MTIIDFSSFEAALQNALLHLNDPAYHPDEPLRQVLSISTVLELQPLLISAIHSLAPLPETPTTSRMHRVYHLLLYRFIQEKPQKETARRLGITPRHLRREQQMAIHVLAERLWPHGVGALSWASGDDSPQVYLEKTGQDEAETADTWHSQLKQEISALQQQMPQVDTDVMHAVHDVIQLIRCLALHRHVQIHIELANEELSTKLHPAMLGQILFTAIDKSALAHHAARIEIHADRWLRWARIRVKTIGKIVDALPESEFIVETLTAHGGLAFIRRHEEGSEFELLLPTHDGVMVLVVDDNLDLVHFYRRFVEGTRYHLVHVSDGRDVIPMIERSPPDVIVLDVMLPDMSGWQLLHDLRRHARAAAIPVVVCTVVRQEALARSLGAAGYLVKPVRRQDFLRVLEEALASPAAAR